MASHYSDATLPVAKPRNLDSEESTIGAKTVHKERHSKHGEVIRDIIIGFADGLTVPFALTAGLSSLGSTKLVILGGLAELFSGSISMGLGAYLAADTECEHYKAEEIREKHEIENQKENEVEEIYGIMGKYGIDRCSTKPIIDHFERNPDMWLQFMMDFELKLERPKLARAWISAATMGLAYFIGGLIPMIPYFAIKRVDYALFASIGITAVILLVFGYVKALITVTSKRACFKSALQTLVVGAAAAGASYGIVRAVDSKNRVDI